MHAAGQTLQSSGLAEKCEQRTNVSHIPFLIGPPTRSELQTDGYSQLKLRMDSHGLGFLMMCSAHAVYAYVYVHKLYVHLLSWACA